jgi:hypothetical protein
MAQDAEISLQPDQTLAEISDVSKQFLVKANTDRSWIHCNHSLQSIWLATWMNEFSCVLT